MNGHSVQLVKGFDGDGPTSACASSSTSGIAWDQPAGTTGSPAFFQLPFFIDGVWGGTLYPANPHVGFNAVQGSDDWVGTKSIANPDHPYTAHTQVPLSDILDALEGHDVQFLAFGIASSGGSDGATTSVSAIYFDGVKYVFANDPTLLINPVISGTAQVGQLLTVDPNVNYTGVTFHYQWYRDAAAISGAVGAGYYLAAADLGHKVSVKVTASRVGFVSIAKFSAKTATVIAGTISTLGIPTITGIAKVGQKLTAVKPTFSPSGTTATYRWYRNNVVITGAVASTYTLTPSDLGSHDPRAGHGVEGRLHLVRRDERPHRHRGSGHPHRQQDPDHHRDHTRRLDPDRPHHRLEHHGAHHQVRLVRERRADPALHLAVPEAER